MPTRTVSVKLTEPELLLLARLQEMAHARSLSDTLREALRVYAQWWSVDATILRNVRIQRWAHPPRRRGQALKRNRKHQGPCGPLDPGRPVSNA